MNKKIEVSYLVYYYNFNIFHPVHIYYKLYDRLIFSY